MYGTAEGQGIFKGSSCARDGTCVTNSINQKDYVPAWKNIVQIECGNHFSFGLKSDGHVVFAGKSDCISAASIARLSNIKMIAAGGSSAVGLTREGKLIEAGVSTVGIKPESRI